MERPDKKLNLSKNFKVIEIKKGLEVKYGSFIYKVKSKKEEGKWLLSRKGPNSLVPELHVTLTKQAIEDCLKAQQASS